ncbi:ATP-binding cassette domain-containing protein [Paraliomyxa miuraensis]|uniref:ATP-binding cassette domain-containing protein n=1 Tax=Paraliomyxa miuraensis TaxID=376150 RepID=UPI00225012AF|nr:ATP-binding cassette domain-containing protein [Paraliomyxa miuraensis]MCX4242656.1 ATP-binding cassette domain-containing protein [Paraliomyxa miuraensis]
MNASIEIDALSIQRGSAGVHDVSLRVNEGEAVAVVGDDQPSLTLLVRCCGGLLRPDRGRVRVAGIDLSTADRRTLLDLRRTVGYVSIHGGLLANMSLRDNVELPLRYHGHLPPAAIAERAAGLLHDAGLSARADERACTLPAEIQKCAAYLRAVALEPRVLLVEDPSALLHPRGRTIVRDIHRQLRARGVTVLVTDDDEDFAAELTDRQLTVEEGVR